MNFGNARLLRPCKSRKADLTNTMAEAPPGATPNDCIIVSTAQTLIMINDLNNEHRKHSIACEGNYNISRIASFGLGTKLKFACSSCHFQSKLYKTYDEVDNSYYKGNIKGPRPAKTNVALQVALKQSSIDSKQVRRIFAALNIKPPSKTHMFQTSKKVDERITELCQQDMSKLRQNLKEINKMRGVAEQDQNKIAAAFDAQYGSVKFGSRNKLGPDANRAIGLTVETMTENLVIIDAVLQNKLCWRGSYMRARGFDVKCPGGHEGCTATIEKAASFKERQMGRSTAKTCQEDGIVIQYLTTDGDGKGIMGVNDHYAETGMEHRAERLSDRIHLSNLQFKHSLKTSFSSQMFPGKNKSTKEHYQRLFCIDLTQRCTAILRKLSLTDRDLSKVSTFKIIKITDSLIQCYQGNHTLCKQDLNECKGRRSNNWWTNSYNLKACNLKATDINMDKKNDEMYLRLLIEMRLGPEALASGKFYTHTNKNESANHVLSTVLPKNRVFPSTVSGRMSSAIMQLNRGATNGTHLMLQCVGAPVSAGSRAAKELKKIQKDIDYGKQYKKTTSAKKARRYHRSVQLNQYCKMKSSEKKQEYKKNQLDEVRLTRQGCANRPELKDHAYAAAKGKKVCYYYMYSTELHFEKSSYCYCAYLLRTYRDVSCTKARDPPNTPHN
ncbi:unnamed protein product [Owenia fusiformis]|nr:unnamed protein product [Owenia fusiformis]